MSRNMLQRVAPDLVAAIDAATAMDRRRALALALRYAADRAGLTEDLFRQALDALSASDSPPELRERLRRRGAELDTEYWNLHDEFEAGGAAESEVLEAFARARVTCALMNGIDAHESDDALAAAYEAISAFSDGVAEVGGRIASVLYRARDRT